MIKLIKGPVPHILQIKGPEWAGVVRDKLAANEPLTNTEKSRYSHQDIKAAIVAETFESALTAKAKFVTSHTVILNILLQKTMILSFGFLGKI